MDGNYKIDNNYIESHIRPFIIGRKNWMFSIKPEGAIGSAKIYSLVETAKGNGQDLDLCVNG
jgi:transposase